MTTAQNYQKKIFGVNPCTFVPALSDKRVAVADFLKQQAALCNSTESAAYEKQKQKLLSAELELTNNFPTTKKLFFHAIKTSENIGKSYFLSDMAVERLLYAHPPVTLEKYIQNIPGLKLPARAKLSLTRFTEDAVWQYTYLKLLNETSEKDYQLQYPKYYEIEFSFYSKVIAIYNHHIKPWRVSHAKETGTILHFVDSNPNPKIKTPQLLSGSVALHYLFEVSYFGRYIRHRIENKLPLTVEKIILNKTPILPFLTDGNAHDETLYWRQTWLHLANIIQSDLLDVIGNQTAIVFGETVNSFHPVDLLWDINSIYPNKKTKYHLQQEVWVQLLEHVSGLSKSDFENLIIDNLIQDNLSFAETACKTN